MRDRYQNDDDMIYDDYTKQHAFRVNHHRQKRFLTYSQEIVGLLNSYLVPLCFVYDTYFVFLKTVASSTFV